MKKMLAVSALAVLISACSNADHRPPHQGKPAHDNPQLEAAMKACHEKVGKSQDRAKFDACMKAKGFEKPADHPQGKMPPKPTN